MIAKLAPLSLVVCAALAGCGTSKSGSAACGISALTAPLVVLESFGKGNLLDQVPPVVPERVPVRFVAGAAVTGALATDSTGRLRLTVTEHPAGAPAGYGVLVVDGRYQVQGVVIYEGVAVPGATVLGQLLLPELTLPLLGVRLDPRTIADPRCPLFPDSLR
ncbi:MAG: hypothetical protein ABJC19_02510 [Gemmatimonadota bacterium]